MGEQLSDPYLDQHGLTDEDLSDQACSCEPCHRCVAREPHEVGHDCQEFPCLRCEARERLTDEPPACFGGAP